MSRVDAYFKISDEDLVKEFILTKNTLLFEIIYDRFSEMIFNKCLSFVKSQDEAKDLTQEIFLKLFVKIHTFKGQAKFTSWLYTFTYNYCVNYITRDKVRKNEKHSIDGNPYDNLLIDTDDYSLFQLKVDKLKYALEQIPPEDKMLLLLKYQDDLSIKDLTTLLNAKDSAIKMRLKRAKAKVVAICNETLN